MTTLKERFEEKFSQGDDIGYFGFKLETRFSEVVSFFRQELLALAEEIEATLMPVSDNLGIKAHNRATNDAAALIRSKADELV
jgi:uncharacterized protein (DUF2164 family)